MTDRHRGYLVTLSENLREDDSQSIIKAIEMIKGVLSVKPKVADIESHFSEQRVKNLLMDKIIKVINP